MRDTLFSILGQAMRAMALLALALGPTPAHAAPLQATPGDVDLETFAFDSGGTLPSLHLHYLTLGTPQRDAVGAVTNAVVLLHGTTGTAATLLQPGFADALYGPGQPLDAAKWYLVIPDGIGAGASSKPSDGLRAAFPHYGYRDQVRADVELLKRIGVARPRLVLGTSMGGMEAWLWAESAPADAFVSVAATPAAISGRNALWREMIVAAIRDDPDWQGGDYPKDHPPRVWLRTAMPLFAIMTNNPQVLQEEAPTRAAATARLQALDRQGASRDASDLLYIYDSSRDYDPAGQLGAIAAPFLAINFADDLLNPPELLRVPQGAPFTAVMLPGGPRSFGHQTLAHADRWAPALDAFLATVPGWR